MKNFKLLILLVVSVVFISCGKEGGSDSKADDGKKKFSISGTLTPQ
jgi:hypothetical protein